jgi:D-alanine--D-alanine ligase
MDVNLAPYQMNRDHLYNNTPSDFDFKLHETGQQLSESEFILALKSVDLVFPVMHGKYGEDGTIQKILESEEIPFVGAPSAACISCFDKHEANVKIKENGFFALPCMYVDVARLANVESLVSDFFAAHSINRAIVKPAIGGSSIGVHSVEGPYQAVEASKKLLADGYYEKVVIEPFCTGIEFTVIIVENRFELPTALLPVEIEADYQNHQIFDFRKKYLPSRAVTYHCPPRFSNDVIETIQLQAEQLFKLFGMKDFSRFDGWLLPDGNIWFSDFNPISGMEQNSFLFIEAARIGMSHRDILSFILRNSLRRQNIATVAPTKISVDGKKPVRVLFGGKTAERQVSVMSGTNVWLKLLQSERYAPAPYLLDKDLNVWKLPYAFCLNHTVEEITDMCRYAEYTFSRNDLLREKTVMRLSPREQEISETNFMPQQLSLIEFLSETERLFIALHGGIGENGELQKLCEERGIVFNGSSSACSMVCMDKYKVGEVVKSLKDSHIASAEKYVLDTQLIQGKSATALDAIWGDISKVLSCEQIIVKPIGDGCSAGVALLVSDKDLEKYLEYLRTGVKTIPLGVLEQQHGPIEMPESTPDKLLFETFIGTDVLSVVDNQLRWEKKTGWVEVTVGVLGLLGQLHCFNPSITIAANAVLSVEEKFQGGTGINITPPPVEYVSTAVVEKVKSHITKVAQALGISGYSRIDAFMNISNGDVIIIEANTLPALVPSTVIYQQALAEKPPISPYRLLEKILNLAQP